MKDITRRNFIAGSTVAVAATGAVAHPAMASQAPTAIMPVMPTTRPPTRVLRAHHHRSYRFAPAHTALLVIDMQKHFFIGWGGQYDPALAPVAPKVRQLVDYARALGCLIVHTREGYAPDLSDVTAYRSSLRYVGQPNALGRFLIRGEPGHDFIDEVRPRPEELVVDKPAFSGFFGGSLDSVLRQHAISHLILCGVTTQCCVHSTLREAVDRGYWCLTVADCCGAYDANAHKAALHIIASDRHLFGWIADLADVRASTEIPAPQ